MKVPAFDAEICATTGGCRWSRRAGLIVAFLVPIILALTGNHAAAQGTPWPLPGGIQAEDFDTGGQGVGYRDNSPGNNGGVYRSTDVDIATTSSGGYTVGWVDAGEWLRYTVNVASAGNYSVVARVASAGAGGTLHIEFDGVDKTGALRVPDTGGWQTYRDLTATVSLEAGVQTMRIVFDSVGSSGAVGNISFIRFDPTSASPGGGGSTDGSGSGAFGGSAWPVPGTIQSEDFDTGGQGVGYKDNSPGNSGGAYRSTDVDIATTPTGGHTVGWIGAGEWLRYTVNVSTAGSYTAVARVASNGGGGTFHIEFNGVDKTGSMRVPNTGGWQTYQDVTATVTLDNGVQSMRIVFDSVGSTGAVGNISYVRLDKGGSSSPSGGSAAPYGGTARALPGTVQAEDFDTGGNGVGYLDNSPGNAGGAYRSTDVDISATSSGGYAVGWVGAGEWLRYSVNVATAGTYTLVARVASAGSGGTFHVEFNGADKTGALRVPNTGSWGTYQDVTATVTLDNGPQAMRLVFDSVGSTGAVGNFGSVRVDPPGTSTPPPPSGSGGGRLRVMTWNIKFGGGDTWGQAQEIASSGADVVLLQEASIWDEYMPSTYPQKLQQITGRTWYSVWAPHGGRYSDNEGTLILSRLPLVDKSTMNAYERGFSRVLVDVGGVRVNVFSLHLDWYDTSLRSAQLDAFMNWARGFSGPRIAGGDFNSWWGEYWIRTMESEYTDTWQDVTGSDENGYTLNGAVRFDFLFRSMTQSWRVTPSSCWTQWSGTSDHAAVIADYSIQ